jgi:hypothetical protein
VNIVSYSQEDEEDVRSRPPLPQSLPHPSINLPMSEQPFGSCGNPLFMLVIYSFSKVESSRIRNPATLAWNMDVSFCTQLRK